MSGGWLGRLSIGKKLALSFSVMFLLLLATLGASLVYLSRVNSYVDRHQRITIPGVVTASDMLRELSSMRLQMHRLLQRQSDSEPNDGFRLIADAERRILAALDTYQATHAARTHPILYSMLLHHGRGELADQENYTVVTIADGISALRAAREDLETRSRTRAPGLDSVEAAYEQVAAKTEAAIAQLIDIHRQIDVEMKHEGDRLVEQARLLMTGMVALLAVLIAVVYAMMQRLVARPLQQLAVTADRVAHNDLTAAFAPWPSCDEVGTLAASLTSMLATLRERGTALMRKTKELEAFTYSVAHDLKGPLREIEGFSSLLDKQFAESDDAHVRHHIDVIRRSALRLTHMIDALLKYSRLEQQDLPKQRFNLLEMVSSLILDRFSHATGAKPKISVDLPYTDLYGEPVSVRQALLNLLDNAAKFTSHRPAPEIRIGGKVTDSERLIWVQDNGIGFDADQKDKIFGLFERLHGPQDYEGTGVGLAIVKMVLEKHHGRVWAESVSGTGSTFYLAFPDGEGAGSAQPSAPIAYRDKR